MTALPVGLREHLAPLQVLWQTLRQRLERSGHAVRGTVTVLLDDTAADRLSGLLGRPVAAGMRRVRLAELDAALRSSVAGRGLVAVVAELTGAPLRDRPAERASLQADWEQVWSRVDSDLGPLTRHDWAATWVQWLHSGVVTRLGPDRATVRLAAAAAVLHELFDAPTASPRLVGELATAATGDAHGLDEARTVPALVLRAVAFALDVPPPDSAAERRALWQRVGVEPDAISGTVLVWALRPPGDDPWSRMMQSRADLGLVTHLTLRELRDHPVSLTAEVVHTCENPQVLQACADAGVASPVACLAGNPSVAGLLLLSRAGVRYHGDFDWPGIAIARRMLERGATPWRLRQTDYLAAVERLPPTNRLPLTGRVEATPWDDTLQPAMVATDVAVHEEAIIDTLLSDLT